MELRDIEIFLTLAEELHFGRTAERLCVSQARVSQAIKKQERRIGGPLFERTSRKVILTPLGAQLHDDLRAGYNAIHDGLVRAANTARGVSGTLRLGVMGTVSHVIRDVLDQFRRSNSGCDLDVREIYFSDPFGPLRSDHADIVVSWRPIREPDLAEGPVVFTEGRLLAVWSGHELAKQGSVSMEDLADHVAIDPGPLHDYWLEAILPTHTPSGRPIPRNGPQPTTFHELLALVAARQCVTPVNEHAGTYYRAHAGVTFVPIHDAPPTEWALVWRTAAETPLIRAFAQATRDVGPSRLEDLLAKTSPIDTDTVTSTQGNSNGAA